MTESRNKLRISNCSEAKKNCNEYLRYCSKNKFQAVGTPSCTFHDNMLSMRHFVFSCVRSFIRSIVHLFVAFIQFVWNVDYISIGAQTCYVCSTSIFHIFNKYSMRNHVFSSLFAPWLLNKYPRKKKFELFFVAPNFFTTLSKSLFFVSSGGIA